MNHNTAGTIYKSYNTSYLQLTAAPGLLALWNDSSASSSLVPAAAAVLKYVMKWLWLSFSSWTKPGNSPVYWQNHVELHVNCLPCWNSTCWCVQVQADGFTLRDLSIQQSKKTKTFTLLSHETARKQQILTIEKLELGNVLHLWKINWWLR